MANFVSLSIVLKDNKIDEVLLYFFMKECFFNQDQGRNFQKIYKTKV